MPNSEDKVLCQLPNTLYDQNKFSSYVISKTKAIDSLNYINLNKAIKVVSPLIKNQDSQNKAVVSLSCDFYSKNQNRVLNKYIINGGSTIHNNEIIRKSPFYFKTIKPIKNQVDFNKITVNDLISRENTRSKEITNFESMIINSFLPIINNRAIRYYFSLNKYYHSKIYKKIAIWAIGNFYRFKRYLLNMNMFVNSLNKKEKNYWRNRINEITIYSNRFNLNIYKNKIVMQNTNNLSSSSFLLDHKKFFSLNIITF